MAFLTLKDMSLDFHHLKRFDGGDFKMVDGRSVMEQFNEIKTILDRYSQHKLALDEFVEVTSITDKLLPSWKNFRNRLKHRKEDINLDELGTHIRIEEDLR
ncbi:hypothetical protein RJ639_029246 [Escallonia herrerae]|uniref:Uncharacterized protein n=1 Tax=Escallonia herrerae TaxID=1293975 RepID=A0AA88X3X4_9ASTE|nr:hypothetical protein RJ639_029246 [Escallonia herrerae]